MCSCVYRCTQHFAEPLSKGSINGIQEKVHWPDAKQYHSEPGRQRVGKHAESRKQNRKTPDPTLSSLVRFRKLRELIPFAFGNMFPDVAQFQGHAKSPGASLAFAVQLDIRLIHGAKVGGGRVSSMPEWEKKSAPTPPRTVTFRRAAGQRLFCELNTCRCPPARSRSAKMISTRHAIGYIRGVRHHHIS